MLRKDESVTEELDLEELIFDFHESGIHVLLQTSNVGMMLTITDGLSRIRAEHLIERPLTPTANIPVATQPGGGRCRRLIGSLGKGASQARLFTVITARARGSSPRLRCIPRMAHDW